MSSLRTDDREDVLSLASLTNAQLKERKAIAKTFQRLLREPSHSKRDRPPPPPSPAVRSKHHTRAWAVFRKFATSSLGTRSEEEQGGLLAVPVQDLPNALRELLAPGRPHLDRSQMLLWLSRQGVPGQSKPLEWAAFSKVGHGEGVRKLWCCVARHLLIQPLVPAACATVPARG